MRQGLRLAEGSRKERGGSNISLCNQMPGSRLIFFSCTKKTSDYLFSSICQFFFPLSLFGILDPSGCV